jgi:uroporphyrinogen decarboxylase
MIFDTWGGTLTPEYYRHYSLAPMMRAVEKLHRHHEGATIPVILFSKGANHSLEQLANSGANGVGLDWTINIRDASKIVGDRVSLQGNLDPTVLYSTPQTVIEQARAVLDAYPKHSGHVFNLGHGIHPGIKPENVKTLVDFVHQYSHEQKSK